MGCSKSMPGQAAFIVILTRETAGYSIKWTRPYYPTLNRHSGSCAIHLLPRSLSLRLITLSPLS